MKKRILILGGGLPHVEIIRIANRMGLETIVMDRNPDAKGFQNAFKKIVSDPSNLKNVLSVARKYNVNGIMPTGDYSVFPAALAAEKLELPTIGTKIAKLAINKSNLFFKFKKANVPIPLSDRTCKLSKAKRICKKIGFPIILKPSLSFGASRGVIKIDSIDELSLYFDYSKEHSFSKEVIIEKYIEGIAHSIESIVKDGEIHVLAISKKVRTSGKYYVDLELHYPLQSKIKNKLIEANEKAIKCLGLKNGACHVEAISRNNDVYIFDFGARGGAGGYIPSVIIPNLTGINMMEKMILIALGEDIGTLNPLFSHGLVYGFFTAPKGKIKRITGTRNAKMIEGIVDFQFLARVGDDIPELKQGGERIGYFVVKAKNLTTAKKRAKKIREALRIYS